jgi:hypothetical protein
MPLNQVTAHVHVVSTGAYKKFGKKLQKVFDSCSKSNQVYTIFRNIKMINWDTHQAIFPTEHFITMRINQFTSHMHVANTGT